MMPFALAVSWARPWAWLLLPVLVLPWWSRWRAAHALDAYAEGALRPWAVRAPGRGQSWWLEALIWLLLLLSLAGPRQPQQQAGERTLHSMNLMLVVGADDAAGWRQAADAVRGLLPHLHGERVGLVALQSSAALVLPCTDDLDAVARALDRFDPGQLPDTPAVGAAGALALARQELLRGDDRARALMWVQAQRGPKSQLQALKQQIAGLQHASISLVLLDLQPDATPPTWRGLLEQAGARSSADAQSGAQQLYDAAIAPLPAHPGAVQHGWRDLSGWPLLAALLLWLVGRGLDGVGRWRWGLLALALLLAGWMLPGLAQSQAGAARAAWLAWRAGDWERAQRLWAPLPGYAARIGEGDSAYRLRRWPQATTAFRQAVLDADTDLQRAQALYNLGNAAFHMAGGLQLALDAYDASLALRPGDAAALRNAHLAQAQWDEEHPSAARSAMGKRAPEAAHSTFGLTDDLTASQWTPPAERDAGARAGQNLSAGGRLDAGKHALPQAGAAAWLDTIDRQAAWRKADLLDDHADAMQRALFERDAAQAQALLQEGH